MKRIFIYLALILASVTVIVVASSRNKIDSLIEMNINALASHEGTPASFCYVNNRDYGVLGMALFCDSRTDNNTIYPCPTSETWGYKTVNHTDRCTK